MKAIVRVETDDGVLTVIDDKAYMKHTQPTIHAVPLFSQSDMRWGGMLIGTNPMSRYGCLVTTDAALAVWAGYDTDPGKFLTALKEVGALEGNYLSHPSRVEIAFPKLKWWKTRRYPPADPVETSYVNWESRPVDLELLQGLLINQPVPLQVDYNPVTSDIEPHFVLGLQYIPDPAGGLEDDVKIMDPITGSVASLMTYFNPAWMGAWMKRNDVTKVARTVLGARVWEVQV